MNFDDIEIGMLLLWLDDQDVGVVLDMHSETEKLYIQWQNDISGWFNWSEYEMELLS